MSSGICFPNFLFEAPLTDSFKGTSQLSIGNCYQPRSNREVSKSISSLVELPEASKVHIIVGWPGGNASESEVLAVMEPLAGRLAG